ncbi:lantibiotic immunity ABC transporter MutE/EpiE family permease subunit [Enterococcus sp. AZ072]|uniref:lantibiotic immunity ABC transporter MutE/EpiE family permease subunit n=1 Tax=unclassified Enterococcus TaxID=2608891 RepID=UPI003D268F93
MGKLIQVEYIKGRRSFGRRSLLIFPLLVSLMAIFLMGGQFTQIGAYNWWYMMLLPAVTALVCINLINPDKRLDFFNTSILPTPQTKVWQAKIWTGCSYLCLANGLIFGLTTFSGWLFNTQYPVRSGLTAGLVLTITWIWQVPLAMFLATQFNSIVTFLSILALNIGFSGQPTAGGALWFIPFAIPARLMAAILGINPNGVPMEAASPLYNTDVILPGIVITSTLFVLLFIATTKWFSQRRK